MTTQAKLFADFMRAVWNDDITDADGNTKYDEYRDANTIAQWLGGKPGPIQSRDGEDDWREYLFHDGSTAGVHVNGSGLP